MKKEIKAVPMIKPTAFLSEDNLKAINLPDFYDDSACSSKLFNETFQINSGVVAHKMKNKFNQNLN